MRGALRCISLYSYIKPQHYVAHVNPNVGCISLYSYIKPQPRTPERGAAVVYLYTPTSNHNRKTLSKLLHLVVYLYTPTSNHNYTFSQKTSTWLYIFILLHQTTTWRGVLQRGTPLYIFILLHQTTTGRGGGGKEVGCISLYSYIKPQPGTHLLHGQAVVYLYTPTSNHNPDSILPILVLLYIFILLHQTTTALEVATNIESCISLYSYIKPQQSYHTIC